MQIDQNCCSDIKFREIANICFLLLCQPFKHLNCLLYLKHIAKLAEFVLMRYTQFGRFLGYPASYVWSRFRYIG
jgi:hypothetical protein